MHLLIIQNQVWLSHQLVGIASVLEGHETEALRAAGLAVDHDRAVDDLPVLREEGAHRV